MTEPTIGALLAARSEDPSTALLYDDKTWTWAEFVAECEVRARVLRALRRPGPFHVGVLLENVPEFLFLIGGAALAGAVVVGINPTRRGGQLAADVRHTDCQLVLTDVRGGELLLGAGGPAPVLRVDESEYGGLRAAHAQGESDWGERGSDPLMLMFTSGSTGAPKAVICTNGRLARIGVNAAANMGFQSDDVLYESMPLFHGNAIMSNVLPAMAVGAAVVLRRAFSASGFLPDVRRYGATYFNYVGRALAYVLATPEGPDDLDNRLRLGFGTEASARDVSTFERRFGCTIRENYGSSEGVISIRRRPGTPQDAMGLPPEGSSMDVIVVAPETGEECPRAVFDEHGRLVNGHEAIGELVDRAGAERFEGYYNNAQAQEERVRGGWYWSGDLAYRDDDGWFYFAGRGSDWLRVDSENFAAASIERILNEHDPVAVAVVYPVPDARTGDQVMAALELRSGAKLDPQELSLFLAGHPDLGTKWAPRYVRVAGRIPVTATGKVAKQGLREQAWESTASGEQVYWQPERGARYRALTVADRQAIRREFEVNGRAYLLPEG